LFYLTVLSLIFKIETYKNKSFSFLINQARMSGNHCLLMAKLFNRGRGAS